MSPVTPNPAAEFSTLAMTKSIDSRSTSAETARRTISRPGLAKMSPMKSVRMLAADRDAEGSAAALVEARQHDPQLAVAQRGAGPDGVVGPLETHGAGEAAKRSLGDVESRLAVLAEGGLLGAGHEQYVL